MPIKHGVFVTERATSVSAPVTAASGVPFAVGMAPVHAAEDPKTVGIPVLCTSWDEFVAYFGYCEDWTTYPLCEVAYSHFVVYGRQPAIFVNLYDPTTMKVATTAADFTVINHKVNLGSKAINDSALVVKVSSTTITKGTDYTVYFENGEMIIELLADGNYYSATTLNIVYDEATMTSINASAVATAMEKAELCMTLLGIVPDMLLAPGFSDNSTVAAAMASKAASINGLFRAKALVDVPTDSVNGATVYSSVVSKKNTLAMVDDDEIVCWPLVKLGNHTFHMSTHLAGVIATVDTEMGAPYCSPSNHAVKVDSLVLDSGAEVLLTLAQANALNAGGVVTCLNFMGNFRVWGNYTACYPTNQDVKDYFIPISRMFDWVANSLVTTFWSVIDRPMTRLLIDAIVDSANIWMNGLTGSGYILGGRVEFIDAENSLENLMAGLVKLHVYITPPSPAQEIDFTLEYDSNYVTEALSAT